MRRKQNEKKQPENELVITMVQRQLYIGLSIPNRKKHDIL